MIYSLYYVYGGWQTSLHVLQRYTHTHTIHDKLLVLMLTVLCICQSKQVVGCMKCLCITSVTSCKSIAILKQKILYVNSPPHSDQIPECIIQGPEDSFFFIEFAMLISNFMSKFKKTKIISTTMRKMQELSCLIYCKPKVISRCRLLIIMKDRQINKTMFRRSPMNFTIHDEWLTSSILCRSCGGKHISSEFMNAKAMPTPEDIYCWPIIPPSSGS